MEPWLSYNGTLIGNAVQTLSYLRRGLGGSMFDVAQTGADMNDVSQLGCYCHVEGTEVLDGGRWQRVEDHPSFVGYREAAGCEVRVHGLPFSETVTADHPYWARRLRGYSRRQWSRDEHEPRWVRADELSERHFIGLPIDATVEIPDGLSIELRDPDWWWLLGQWWGDGSVSGSTWAITISVARTDVGVAERLEQIVRRSGRHAYWTEAPGCRHFHFSWRPLARWLKTWQVPGNSRKCPPEWVERLPLDWQAELVRGYVAADGCEGSREVRVGSVYLPGLLALRRMLGRLGVAARIRTEKPQRWDVIEGRRVWCQASYSLGFRQGAERLGYYDEPMSRRGEPFIEDGWLWSRVRDVLALDTVKVCPITTESHDYVTHFGRSHNCDEMNDGPYVDPATDLAAWWDPLKPESDSFLGLIPWTVNVVPSIGRDVSEGGMSGSQLGRMIFGGTLVQVSGVLYSATAAGMEYGERWLIAALRGAVCRDEGCDVGALCILPACPEGAGYTSSSYRTLHRAGLIDYTAAQPTADGVGYYMRNVSFQMRSEFAYLFEDPVPLQLATPMRRNVVTGTAVTGEWPGEAGVRIRVKAGGPNDTGQIRIAGVARKPGTDVCAGPGGFFSAAGWWNWQQQGVPDVQSFYGSGATTITTSTLPGYAKDLTGHGLDLAGNKPPNWFSGTKYLQIPDGNGGLSTPDSVNLSITGDLAIEVGVSIASLALGATGFYDLSSKWDGGAGQSSWLLRYNRTTSAIEFLHSSNGTATVSTASFPWYISADIAASVGGVDPPVRVWFRADLDVVNGASHTKSLYISTDGTNYSLVGQQTIAGTTAVFDSTTAVWFCGRPSGGFFHGGFYAGRIGAGLWPSPTIRADPNIDTDADPTSATFSDGTQTWTIVRPALGAKPAVVYRSLGIAGVEATTFPHNVLLGRSASFTGIPAPGQIGDFRASEAFTVVWYGKLWGTTTGQTLAGRRMNGPTGAGWELRRGATANTPQAVITDGTATVTATGPVVTQGQPVVIAMVRSIVADSLRVYTNAVGGSAVSDTTTGDLFLAPAYLALGGLYDIQNQIYGSEADAEEYGFAVFHGVEMTAAQLTEVGARMALATPPSLVDACFDVLVDSIPAGATLTLNGATHQIEVRRDSDSELLGGIGYLDLSAPMSWPEQGPCAEVCYSVDPNYYPVLTQYRQTVDGVSNTNTTVTIEQINREV